MMMMTDDDNISHQFKKFGNGSDVECSKEGSKRNNKIKLNIINCFVLLRKD